MNPHEDLKAFLDGELPPSRMAEMHDLIARDPALAQELESLQQISASLRAAAYRPEAVGLDATLARLERKRRFQLLPLVPWLTAAGAVGLAIFLGSQRMREEASSDMSVAMKSTVGTASESAAAPTAEGQERSLLQDKILVRPVKPPKSFSASAFPDSTVVTPKEITKSSAKSSVPAPTQKSAYREPAQLGSRLTKTEVKKGAPTDHLNLGLSGETAKAEKAISEKTNPVPATLVVTVERIEDAHAAISALELRYGVSVRAELGQLQFDRNAASTSTLAAKARPGPTTLTVEGDAENIDHFRRQLPAAVRDAVRRREESDTTRDAAATSSGQNRIVADATPKYGYDSSSNERARAGGFGGGGFGGGGMGGGGGLSGPRGAGGGMPAASAPTYRRIKLLKVVIKVRPKGSSSDR